MKVYIITSVSEHAISGAVKQAAILGTTTDVHEAYKMVEESTEDNVTFHAITLGEAYKIIIVESVESRS